ncbi:MAG TPA: hypothetical protein VF163_08220 [Micromonosporaceae bacterium]
MSGEPITTDVIADLVSALGRPEAAATLRWNEEPRAPLVDELAALETQVEHLEAEVERLRVRASDSTIGELEDLLCKRCAKKWEEQQS